MKRTVLGILALAVMAQAAAVKTVCSSGCDYATPQAAINAAEFGWIIELTAGQTFDGEMQLKKKTGTPAYIVIRSSRAGELPGGVRVTASDTAKMARLQNTSVVVTSEAGASYYRLEGLEIAPTSGHFVWFLVAPWPQNVYGWIAIHDASDRDHHIIIDRCYIHGIDGQDGPSVGVYLETGYTEITNCWIGEIKNANGEAKAILNVGGPGPFVFRNNHLEAAAITTLMGGADPSMAGVRATDVTFLGNHYYRPWKWRIRDITSDPTGICMWDSTSGEFAHNTSNSTYWHCQSGAWVAIASGAYPTLSYWQKNQFELKNASRVLFDGNLIENAWVPAAQGQKGAAILLNQVGYDSNGGIYDRAAVVEWATIQNNQIKNTAWGIAEGGNGQTYFSRMHDITYRSNLFTSLGGPQSIENVGGNPESKVLQTNAQLEKVRFLNNTVISVETTGYPGVGWMNNQVGERTYGMAWMNNIHSFRFGGFWSTDNGVGESKNSLDSNWDYPSRSMSKNVIVDTFNCSAGGCDTHPSTQLLTASDNPPYSGRVACPTCAVGQGATGPMHWDNGGVQDVGFVNYAGGDYHLASSSPYKGWAHEGADPGADIDIVEWSTAQAVNGADNPYLDFRVRAVTPGRTSASLRFTAYDANSCSVTVSDRPDLATTVFQQTDGGGNRDRVAEIAGLSANTRYFYRVVCKGSYRRGGVFITTP